MGIFKRKKKEVYIRFENKHEMEAYERYREWYLTKDIYNFRDIFSIIAREMSLLFDSEERKKREEFENYIGGYWIEGKLICAKETHHINPDILKEGDLICTDNGVFSRCFIYLKNSFVQIHAGDINDIKAVTNYGRL